MIYMDKNTKLKPIALYANAKLILVIYIINKWPQKYRNNTTKYINLDIIYHTRKKKNHFNRYRKHF